MPRSYGFEQAKQQFDDHNGELVCAVILCYAPSSVVLLCAEEHEKTMRHKMGKSGKNLQDKLEAKKHKRKVWVASHILLECFEALLAYFRLDSVAVCCCSRTTFVGQQMELRMQKLEAIISKQ